MRNSRRGRLVLTLLLLAAFTLITVDYRSNSLGGVRRVMSTVFGPIEGAVTHVTHPIGSWFDSVAHAGSYKSRNAALRSQIAELNGQLHLTTIERNELAQDQKLLHIAGLAQFTIVGARVVAYGGGLVPEQTVTINKGTADGITAQETVIDGDGLVGKTITVGRNSATVLLADDRTFTVGARTEAKQLELGSVSGGGPSQPMSLTLLNPGTPLTVGEQLVTIGSNAQDTPFVPEVPIGKITHVSSLPTGGLEQTATVQPYVDFTSIDILAVVVHAPTNVKHDSLLPAKPTPAPTVTVTVTATPGETPSVGSEGSSPPAGTSSTPGITPTP
jgi:rod shape-determining protein MreC